MGWNAIKLQLHHLDGMEVEAGVIEGKSPPKMAQIAAWNELGAKRLGKKHIPSRPAFRTSMVKNANKYVQLTANLISEVYRGNLSIQSMMDKTGKEMQLDIKNSLLKWSKPKNAPATVKDKGFDDPWIRTGLIVAIINFSTGKSANPQ